MNAGHHILSLKWLGLLLLCWLYAAPVMGASADEADDPPIMGNAPSNPLFYGAWKRDVYTDRYVWAPGIITHLQQPHQNLPPAVYSYRIIKDYGHALLLASRTETPFAGIHKERLEIHQLTTFDYDEVDLIEFNTRSRDQRLLQLVIYACHRPDLEPHLFSWPTEKILERFRQPDPEEPNCRFATDSELLFGGHPAMPYWRFNFYRIVPLETIKTGVFLRQR